MKSIFDPVSLQEIKDRVGCLSATTKAHWGKMDVGQMLAHCAMPIEGQLGKIQVKEKGNFLVRLLFKKMLYSDRPYRKGLPTAKSFVIKESKPFAQEASRLKAAIAEAHEKGLKGTWLPHPTFGQFSPEQVGMAMYKHLDHHLRQFGA